MDSKNICFIAGTLGQGGAERQLFYYLKSLVLNNYSPIVLCLTKGEFWEKPITDLGVPVIFVGESKNKIIRLFSIINQISKTHTDVIHSQHFHTNLYAFFAGLFLRIKAFGSLRSNVFDEMDSIGRLGQASLLLPRAVIANSRAAILNAMELGKSSRQLFYLPNIVDSDFFSPSTNKNSEQIMRVVFVGSMYPVKRIDRIIQIAKLCLDENLSVDFKLYGGGELLQALMNLARKVGVLNNNLEFMGSIEDTRIAYQNADILLLTSDHEGTPNVVLEAMACGLPVISTRVGDVPELIEDGINGFVTDIGDEKALFSRLVDIKNNPSLRITMGQNNREKIIRERSFQSLFPYLQELYKL